ncbi:YggS family pyridoxal phosphate-dependent enzyme [Nevskia sp.]|uniref:YggS family pyridoxal phosphate-dependent enzyme n=1 Tax=Nevskia sp. TaxID=1929292 RepID=UPI0025E270DE|nr:YggS family pyridoxal phosphate-dependent enzyme [Nevskia sp.]
MSFVSDRLTDIRRRLAAVCARAGRMPADIRLIAVSKTFDADAVAEVAELGQLEFGESYMREALDKIGLTEAIVGQRLIWHFIGPIQGNKCRALAGAFAFAHGVDRLKIAERLSELRAADLPPLDICVQVNVSGEASKGGVAPDDAAALCAAIARLPQLRLRGLMCIPAPVDDPEDSRASFRLLRELRDAIRASGSVDADAFDQLSMGMSDDFEVAIEEGATLVRVGSALFGARPG